LGFFGAQASLWTGEFEIFKFSEKPLQITAENTARIAGEFAGNGDIIFGIGIIGASTAGMLFYTVYQIDLAFRTTTLACLSSGRALDNEGNLIHPPVPHISFPDELPNEQLSDLTDDLPDNEVSLVGRITDARRTLLLDPGENDRLVSQIRRTQSQSSMSLLSEIDSR
jgi:hypothetical protein